MNRPTRIAVAVGVLLLSGALALGLARLGNASAGPVRDAMDGLGRAVTAAEHLLMELVRGPGRAERLAWFEPYRRDPDRLRHPDRVLLGAYEERLPTSLEGVFGLETALDTTFPLVHVYVAWGDRPTQRFPGDLLRAVRRSGSVPVISWEPWLTDFRRREHPEIPRPDEREPGGMKAVAAGQYDFHVDSWARSAAEYGDPLLIRFAHEMNDPYRYPWGPQNNDPGDFIAAWRHVVERFDAAGADNVLWVWSPHPAYGEFERFYPGDRWVDWTGATVLNYGNAAPWSRWWSFEETFGRYYEELAAFGKPLMISELGSLEVGGDRPEWYRKALEDLPTRYPAVRAVLFFASSYDATVTGKAVNWSIADDPAVTRVVSRALRTWDASAGDLAPTPAR